MPLGVSGSERAGLPDEITALVAPGNRENPYPLLARIRRRGPYRPVPGLVVVAQHAQISALLRDPGLSAARHLATLSPTPRGPRTRNFLHLDPPEHTRYRRLVSGAFTRRRVETLGPRIRAIAAGLVEDAAARDSFDLIEDFAYPLPLRVICELLGVPFADRHQLLDWSGKLAAALDPPLLRTGRRMTPEEARAQVDFVRYFRALIDERRREPHDDLISRLIQTQENGERLDDEEVLATCLLLLHGGHETSANLIANAVLALLRHPAQFRRLAADPTLAASVVEETLRYDAPVQMTGRVAVRPGVIGDVELEPGDTVLMLLGAANRDPEAYPEPDTFDPERSMTVQHLSFSAGVHFCLGAGLARLEVGIALELFAAGLIDPRLASGDVVYKPNLAMRGPAALMIETNGLRAGFGPDPIPDRSRRS